MKVKIRKAVIQDARDIHSLINRFAKRVDMLPRSLSEIYENLRDFYVYADNEKALAVASLHILWDDLAEIRSVAVSREFQGRGIGRKLIRKCLKEARSLGVKRVFALTFHPRYFIKLGFKDIDKNELPHKIWGDCQKCPKFPDCSESAVIMHLR